VYQWGQHRGNQDISYARDIQPLLASNCYACHGPDGSEREAGLRLDIRDSLFVTLPSGSTAVSLDDLDNSELIRRISSSDPEYMMPPPEFPKRLDEEEVETLTEWVNGGAPYETHWAFRPIEEQPLPQVSKKRWPINGIDHFILAAQDERGLSPSPIADKRTLLRRVTFDLHGLPPTKEELDAFLQDMSPQAYEKVVDRLLASPRYGERWARHWLDIAHYGETHGYDKDQRRPNAWPYRDYVIDALNRDIPYSRFVEDQLAGDVLYPDEPSSTVALGFLAAGPWDLVGHVEVKNGTKDKRIVRNLDRDDMVATTMGAFTSMTAQCARCHDHKFDPITQEDYYSLQAVFSGIDRANRPYDEDPELHVLRTALKNEEKALEKELAAFGQKLTQQDSSILAEIINEQVSVTNELNRVRIPPSTTNGFRSLTEQTPHVEKWVEVDLGALYPVEKVTLVPARPLDDIPVPGFGFPWRFKVEAASTSDFSRAIVLADFTEEAYSQRTDRNYELVLPEPVEARFIRVTVTELWKGRGSDYFFALSEMQVYSGNANVAFQKSVRALDSNPEGKWDTSYLVDGYDSNRGIEPGISTPASRRAVREREATLAKLRSDELQVRMKPLSSEGRATLQGVIHGLETLRDSLDRLPEPDYVYAAASDFPNWFRFVSAKVPRPIYLLNRGDTEQPGKEIGPGTISALSDMPSRFLLLEDHEEGVRRAALAEWIVDESNVLTWRSIVNRVWHYHFGQGLVTTPNDFGKMGGTPSHPELLDWLAKEFLDNGQSLKWLHRLIVTSATYRQQARHKSKYAEIDGGNQYLWRANRRQLEAEAIRDAVLAVSGKLNLTMGGPGFDAFLYEDDHSPRYLYSRYDVRDPSSFRRAIYRSIVRTVPDPFMTTLDCADPSQSTPVRNETVTALQALAALNNPFMVRQAGYFAERLEASYNTVEEQLIEGFNLALLRDPTPGELNTLAQYTEEHGLAASCRLIFAMNEFIYVD